MADENDVSVTFGAQVDGLTAGIGEVKAQMATLGPSMEEVTGAITAQTEAITAALSEMAASFTAAMHESAAATEEEEVELQGLLATVREGVESFNELKESVMGLGELMMAAFAVHEIEEFVGKIGEGGEQVQHAAQAFGMTTEEVQRLQAVFTAAGAGPEAFQAAMARLDRASSQAVSGNKRAGEAFKALGVDINEPMTPAQRMQEVLQGFTNIPGPEKAQVAFAIFGRQMIQYAGIIGATKDQLTEYLGQADRFGDVSGAAVGKAAALGAALNENKNAWAGVGNVLGDSLAPAFIQIVDDINEMIAAFTRSYNEGGAMRGVMDLIGTTVSVIGSIFEDVGEIIATVWGAITGETGRAAGSFDIVRAAIVLVGDAFAIATGVIRVGLDSIGGVVREVSLSVQTLGTMAKDALTLNWGAIEGDWQTGLKRVSDEVHATAVQIVADVAEAAAQIATMGKGSPKQEESPQSTKGKPWNDGSGPKPKKPKDDSLSEWNQELAEKQASQENWYRDQNEVAIEFWSNIQKLNEGSAKDQRQVALNIAQAQEALDKEGVQSAEEAAKKKAEQAGGNVALVESIYAGLEERLRQSHADTGAEWKKVEDAKADAVKKAVDKMVSEQERLLTRQGQQATKDHTTAGKNAESGFDIQRDQVKANSSSGLISARQEAAEIAQIDAQQAATDIANSRKMLADQETNLDQRATAARGNAQLLDQISQERVTDESQNADRIATIQTQAAQRAATAQIAAIERIQQSWHTNINSIVSTFGSGMLNMAQHGGTLEGVMLKVGESMEETMLQAVEKMVTGWITQLGVMVGIIPAQTAATNLPQITSAAGVAAANTFASTAAIPVIGPEMAPGAAAAAYAEVMSFSVASMAGGGIVPFDEFPATLHKDEWVLPASISGGLKSMIGANGNSSPTSGGGRTGGDTYHMAVSATDSRSVRRMMTSANIKAAAKAFSRHK